MKAHFDLQQSCILPLASVPFRWLVGSLLWIVRHTHAEIIRPVVHLGQFCTWYARPHCLADLRTLKYLYICEDKRLAFRDANAALEDSSATAARIAIFSDSDLAMGSMNRKSY